MAGSFSILWRWVICGSQRYWTQVSPVSLCDESNHRFAQVHATAATWIWKVLRHNFCTRMGSHRPKDSRSVTKGFLSGVTGTLLVERESSIVCVLDLSFVFTFAFSSASVPVVFLCPFISMPNHCWNHPRALTSTRSDSNTNKQVEETTTNMLFPRFQN